ncbi:hypothetical protein [Tenacibaculum sp. nBUS_03]|uniref:hypothetical protein n=1 Tax=Tenacibaculum sp. nBUS_03 TaxID=3395320 RepID=UPI003EBADBB0
MLKNILKLGGVQELNSSAQKEIEGGGGQGNSHVDTITISPSEPDYWTPGNKYACYVRPSASGNHPSFSHISNCDQTGKTYICYPY